MRFKILMICSVFSLMLLSGCVNYNNFSLSDVEECYLDVVYKNTPVGAQKLDIYMPINDVYEKIPVMVYIHGGGWVGGGKGAVGSGFKLPIAYRLLMGGYAVISINYRLVDGNTTFPSNIEDVKDAFRWTYKNAEEYNFDIDNIGVWGSSAGGHLAQMICFTDDNDFVGALELSNYSSKVQYAVDDFGPTDLNALFLLNQELPEGINTIKEQVSIEQFEKAKKRIFDMFGIDIEQFHSDEDFNELRDLCKLFSPTTYADSNDSPIIIFHGTDDATVVVNQSILLHELLDEINLEHEYIQYDGVGHGFSSMTPIQKYHKEKRTIDFIKKYYNQ